MLPNITAFDYFALWVNDVVSESIHDASSSGCVRITRTRVM
ncbi:hypothetical protein HSB1_44020 [Halogranum salarium B-1]|uniref:Uncharacterized protein n=1 Tax=Halogranum salarium B-1 TaxID=1210908 RepID=J3JCY3_9EURY|nr:hypothetical protein HSB1_44020 [Halogranum salarium B-1]